MRFSIVAFTLAAALMVGCYPTPTPKQEGAPSTGSCVCEGSPICSVERDNCAKGSTATCVCDTNVFLCLECGCECRAAE